MSAAAPLRVGIIGANPERGWASRTHLPAVTASTAVELVAVATTRPDSARAAAVRYGAERGYGPPWELITDPKVEAVTVAVKVPQHQTLVEAALEAGKHVYCEWPLGVDTADAEALRDLAAARGVRTVVGLQTARGAQVARARELIVAGRIGRPLSAALHTVGGIGGPRTAAADAWRSDAANGTNVLTVAGAHALDTMIAVIGELEHVAAVVATRFAEAIVTETGETIPVSSPDQVALAAATADGVVVAAHIQGAIPTGGGTWIELRGEDGVLTIAAVPSLSGAPVSLRLRGADGKDVEVEGGQDDPRACVERVYADLAVAVRTGVPTGPDFDHAVRRHRLLDEIRDSSAGKER